jgi:hypothetical protein
MHAQLYWMPYTHYLKSMTEMFRMMQWLCAYRTVILAEAVSMKQSELFGAIMSDAICIIRPSLTDRRTHKPRETLFNDIRILQDFGHPTLIIYTG